MTSMDYPGLVCYLQLSGLFPNKCDEDQGLPCDPSHSILQFHVVSDLQALEHVSKPHNKPAKRGCKNYFVEIESLTIMAGDGIPRFPLRQPAKVIPSSYRGKESKLICLNF